MAPGSSPPAADTDNPLTSIDRLLGAAFDLMKQEPSLDPGLFEQLRQLRVRIRQTVPDAAAAAKAVPLRAPALYDPRAGEGALAFTARVYAPWLGASAAISRADLKRLDPRLYNALYNLPNPNEQLDGIGLYTAKALNDLKLKAGGALRRPPRTLKLSDMSPQERERARLFNLARRRRQRAAKQ